MNLKGADFFHWYLLHISELPLILEASKSEAFNGLNVKIRADYIKKNVFKEKMYKTDETHDSQKYEGFALDYLKLNNIIIKQLPATQFNWADGGDRKQIQHDILRAS